jgi:lipoprotein-anchoring transpeptidase ErfK/SrfK
VNQTRSRISRFVLLALTLTILIGLATHYGKWRRSVGAAPLAADQVVNVQNVQRTAPVEVSISAPTTAPTAGPATESRGSLAVSEPRGSAAGLPATRPVIMAMETKTPDAVPHASVDISAAPTHPIADAKAKIETGALVEARKILNDALIGGTLSNMDQATAKALITEVNRTLIFSPKLVNGDPLVTSHTVQPGERLSKIASDHNMTWEFLAQLNGLSDPKKLRAGKRLKIIDGPFTAVVKKSEYTIDIYLGDAGKPGSMFVTSFPVGLGQDDSTPTGVWMVESQHKLKHPTYYSPRGEGIIDSGDPKNPLGPCWIGLTGTDGHAVGQMSYGIHGTSDPASIGHQSSLGCIRLHNEDALVVFDMLVEGKSIVVVRD